MKIDFDKGNGQVPAIIQDWKTRKVLMLGYMNEEALKLTKSSEKVTFYSRSKNRLTTVGETNENFLLVKEISLDCDSDALLIKVEPTGTVCKNGNGTCFKEKNTPNATFLHYLQRVIADRKNSTSEKSYTKSLFEKGINKIAQKVGEEAVELVIEAKDNDKDLFKNEAADLLYHLLVLLEAKDIDLQEIIEVLVDRHK